MKLLRHPDLPTIAKGCVATIGNFDGLHTAHQHIVRHVQDKARALDLPAVVISFEPIGADHVVALVYTVIGSLAMAVAATLMRRLDKTGAFNLQFWIAAIATVSLFVLTVLIERPDFAQIKAIPLADYWSPVYSAVGATIIGHGSFYYLLQRYQVSDVAPFITLSSLFAVIFGVLLLGDQMTWRIVVGGLLTLIGVTVVAVRTKEPTTSDNELSK